MFSNKHVVLALLVAPVLAVLSWFLAGQWLGEKPHAAVEGSSYPLVAQSNCRYHSGRCDLRNGDMRLSVVATAENGKQRLVLTSGRALQAAYLAVGSDKPDEGSSGLGQKSVSHPLAKPEPMQRVDHDGLRWQTELERLPMAGQRLYVAATANGAHWYGDFGAIFLAQGSTSEP